MERWARRACDGRRACSERGSAAPLLALIVVATGGLCLALGQLGGAANARAQATTAADAAALAGAAEGERAAREVAARNGGELVWLEVDGAELEVEVRVGDTRARARAVGVRAPGVGAAVAGLVPELQAALAEAERLLGGPVPITSGWRSRAAQQALYDDRATNPFPVARPGTSMHERGRAVDVPRSFAPRLAAIGHQVGLCRPWPQTDPVHFELCRSLR